MERDKGVEQDGRDTENPYGPPLLEGQPLYTTNTAAAQTTQRVI
jgi:hypothetical protein